ncbi:MAG: cytochrome c [Chthoniobacteraceae bacterium]
MNPRLLLFMVGAPLLLFSCGRLPGKPTPADIPIEPKDLRDFSELYSLNCAACHGEDGRGNGALALANPVYLAIANDDVLRNVTANGVPKTLMPAFAVSAGGMLKDDQIEILVAGIRSHWAKPDAVTGAAPPPYAADTKGDPQRGSVVFTSFCASCHGPEGQGTEKSGSIVDGTFLALVSDQNLRSTVIAGRPDRGHPDWRHCVPGQALTDQQVTDVVAWLTTHRTATPGEPYTQNP